MNGRTNPSWRRNLLTLSQTILTLPHLFTPVPKPQLGKLVTSFFLAGIFLCLIPWLITAPVGAAGINVWKTTSANPVKAGEPFTYTIHVENTTGNQINLIITDEVPDEATVVDFGGGVLTDGVMQWSVDKVNHGNTIEVYFVVVVNQASQIINANYEATSSPNFGIGDSLVTTIIPNDPAVITIDANPNPTTVGGSTELVITVKDAYDNPVADGINVTLTFDKGTIDGQSAGTTITATTSGGNGQISKTFSAGVTAGTAHLVAAVGATVQQSADIEIQPGPPVTLTVAATPASIPANGTATAAINVTVQDSYGNPAAQTPVTITTSLGQLNGAGTTTVMNTNNGQVLATLGGTTAGLAHLTVTAASLVNTSQSVYLAPGPPTHLSIQANPASLIANGASTSAITLLVLDEYDNRVDATVPVTITTSRGTLTGGTSTYVETTTDGEVQVHLTSSTQAGPATVSASAWGLNTTTNVNFIPGPPAQISLDVNPPAIAADGAAAAVLTAIVRDSYNNTVSTPVTVTFAAGAGTLSPNSSGSTINGVITRTLYSNTVLGTVPLTATAAGLGTPATGSVLFTVGPPHSVDVSMNPTSPITVGVPVSLVLTVRDIVDHVVPGATITVTSGLGAITPASTGVTDENGQLALTLLSTRSGFDTIGVSGAGGVLTVNGGSLTFKPDLPVQASLVANPTELFANGVTTAVVTATLTDQYGNAVPGVQPTFITTLGALSGASQTNALGIVTRTLQSTTSLGAALISVTDMLTVTNAHVDFVAGPPAIALLTAQPGSATANGANIVTLVITVTDSISHPIVGQTLSVTSTIGVVSGSDPTNAQGVLNRTLTSTKSGQAQIYVAGILATGSSITFQPGPLTQVRVTPYASSTFPLPVSAGVPVAFSATGYDAYDNPLTGLTFAWSAVSQGGNGIISPNGIFTGTTMGIPPNKVMVRATVGGTTGSSTVIVGPGAAAQATLDAEPTVLRADGFSTSALTFYVRDVYGNPVNSGITLTVTSSIGTVEGTTPTTTGGVAYRTIHSTQAGLATIQVSNLLTVTGERVITFTPGGPSRANVSASPASLPANGVATSTLTITLLDYYGNPVGADYNPTVQVSAGTISGSGTTDANGVVTRTLTAPLTAGAATFTIRNNSSSLLVSGDTVAFVVGELHHVAITPGGFRSLTAGQPQTFTAQAYDSYNAPIPDGVTYGWFMLFEGPGRGEQNTFDGPVVTFTGTSEGAGVRLTAWAEEGSPYTESSVNITVLPGLPTAGVVLVEPAVITADGVSPITFTLTNLADNYLNQPQDGTVLTATIQSLPAARINSGAANNGEATISLAATTQAGTYPFSTSTAAGPLTLDGPTQVTFIPGPPAQAEVISASPPAIVADGASTTMVRLQLRDAYGNKVAAGLNPVVTATLGTILPGGSLTDENGVLTRTLEAGLVVGQAQLCITGFGATGPTVSLIPGPAATAHVSVVTSTLAAGGSGSQVTFEVRDAWDHPVADGAIITPTLTPEYGTFSGIRQTVGGLIRQTLTPATSVGTATISSPGISLTGDTLITFEAGPAALATVTAAPTTLKVGETTALILTFTDAYSNIVPPTLITVSALIGSFNDDAPTISRMTGQETAAITATLSSTTAGLETFLLTGPGGPITVLPTSNVVHFLPEQPQEVTLSPSGPITATAGVTLTVTASSRDLYGNAVDPWTPVNYTWWQNAAVDAPGYGLFTPADAYARSVGFKPVKVGPNLLWATGGVTTSNVLTVNVIAGSPGTATMAISPATIPADGVATTTITLTRLADAFGNVIPDGVPLTITVQSIPPVVKNGTASNGTMVGILPASTHAGTHAVVVTGAGGPLALAGSQTITFTPGPPAHAFISASPTSLPADGSSTANLSLTIRDAHFNLVADGTPVTVTASAGALVEGSSGATVNGQVSRTLRAPVLLGTAQFGVQSTAGPLLVWGDTVEFVPGPPAQALVTAIPAQVVADGLSTAQITVTIKDGYGFTIPENGTAFLSVNRGSLTPATMVASTGSFTATFRAGATVGPAGLAVVYNGAALPTVGDTLELIPGPPVTATISANPTSLVVGSSQQSLLNISLADSWGNPVADGEVVTVTTSLGAIIADNSPTQNGMVTRALTPGLTMGTAVFTVTTNARGIAPAGDRVTLAAGVLDHITVLPAGAAQVTAGHRITFTAKGYDFFGNETGTGVFTWQMWPNTGYGALSTSGVFTGTLAGAVGIQATQGTVFSPIKNVTVLPGAAITAVVRANPITIPVGGVNSSLTITARDAFGNLAANGTVLTVTSNLGTVTGSSTTQAGVLTRTLTSGNYYGAATVVVNGFEAGGDKVNFVPRSRLTANPGSLYADGLSQTTLTIEVYDISGLPIADGTKPSVTASLGTLACNENGTIAGRLTCTLQASLTPGTAHLYVDSLLVEGSVPFLVGPAAVARISANPPWLIADGVSRSTLTLRVEDAYGHVITNAGSLTISTTLGSISGPAPTSNGVTTRVLTASTQSGTALISVTGLNPAGDSKIHFVGNTLQDSGFESGNLNSWSVGQVVTPTGSTPAYSAMLVSSDAIGSLAVNPPGGSTMVRLGAMTEDKTAHQLSEAWLSQPVYVQAGGLTQLTFSYRILSYDVAVGSPDNGSKEWDPFEVYLNGREVLQDGFGWSEEWKEWYLSGPTSPKDMGWKQGVLDLSLYTGQVVTLQFHVANRQAPQDNTWVYLDNFNLEFRETETVRVFLPVVLR